MIQTFILDIEPIPKARARRGRAGHFYTPKKTKSFEGNIFSLLVNQGAKMHMGAITLSIECTFLRPKSDPKRKFHTVKPDLDNLVKSITDACNGLLYKDDNQIIALSATKRYGPKAGILLQTFDVK